MALDAPDDEREPFASHSGKRASRSAVTFLTPGPEEVTR